MNFIKNIAIICCLFSLSSCNIDVLSYVHKTYKKSLKLKDQSFTATDGYKIAYSDNMLENKPTIFFIHGYLISRENFYTMAKYLKTNDYRMILVDMPGFGESTKNPNGDYRLTSQAKRLDELIKHLKIKDVHLVGTSLGGGVAIALNSMNTDIKTSTLIAPYGMPLYTKEFPKMIDHFIETGEILFLIDSPYTPKKTKNLLSMGMNIPPYLMPSFVANIFKNSFIQNSRTTNKVGKDILYDKSSLSAAIKNHPNFIKFDKITSDLGIDIEKYINNSDEYVHVLNLVNKNKSLTKVDPIGASFQDMTPNLRKIQNPVLVVWGTKDKIIHYKTMETMVPHIKNGTYKLIKNGCHAIPRTKAKKISKEIKKLITNTYEK